MAKSAADAPNLDMNFLRILADSIVCQSELSVGCEDLMGRVQENA